MWGAEKTLFVSGIVVMLGHIALSLIPGVTGLLIGLPLIALGSGGVKPTASTMIGSLYESEERRVLRDAGFSIFYISVNIGSFFAPLITGLLQDRIGFHYGFGVAAVGIAVGLVIYSQTRRALPLTPPPNPLPAAHKATAAIVALAGAGLLIFAVMMGWLNVGNFFKVLLTCVLLAVAVYFLRLFTSPQISAQHKRHFVAHIPMFLAVSVFVALFMQFYTMVTVYFEKTVNRSIGGFTVPVSWKDSMESVWVVLFSGIFAAMWTKLGKRQPKTSMKFALGLLITGFTYACFIPFIRQGTPMPVLVFALATLVLVLGELLISPITISFATKIAPPVFKTQMVALNFLAFSIGFTLGGLLFKNFYDAKHPADFYQLLFYLGAAAGGLMLLCVPALNKILGDVD